MSDLELRVRRECLMQDFVKNLVRLVGCFLWYNVCIILATSNWYSSCDFRTSRLVYERLTLLTA